MYLAMRASKLLQPDEWQSQEYQVAEIDSLPRSSSPLIQHSRYPRGALIILKKEYCCTNTSLMVSCDSRTCQKIATLQITYQLMAPNKISDSQHHKRLPSAIQAPSLCDLGAKRYCCLYHLVPKKQSLFRRQRWSFTSARFSAVCAYP